MTKRKDEPFQIRTSRILKIHMLWIILLAVLVGRLFWLVMVPAPIYGGRGLMKASAQTRWRSEVEHFQLTVTDDARGKVLFRDGTSWSVPTLVDARGHVLAGHVLVAPELLGHVGRPDVWPDRRRVVPEEGRFGLEQTLDSILTGTRPGMQGTLQPNMVRPLGQQTVATEPMFRIEAVSGANVVTTLSRDAQKRAETLLAKLPVKHASIVSISLPSHQIRVLASKNHRKSDALTAVAPGSVFKIVTEAAALETHIVQTRTIFNCMGVVHLPHVRMHCWKVHGDLSLKEAFIESCDTAFATLGVELGRQPISVEAKRFGLMHVGLGEIHGQPLVPGADKGVIFRRQGEDAGLLANTAIGQEDVRITPLQGALLAATVASHGRYLSGELVKEVKSDSPSRRSLPISTPVVSPACDDFTAAVISQGMWDVVHQVKGTAYRLHDLNLGAKTGTAELPNGRVNAWLIGYRLNSGKPVEAFAFTVVDEPSAKAHQILYQMVRSWYGHE